MQFGTGKASLAWSTEYTTHTMMADIMRGRFYIRAYAGLNWSVLDLAQLTGLTSVAFFPTTELDPMGGDLNAALLKAGTGATVVSGGATSLPGLYFCGMYVAPSGMLREAGREAQRIAELISP